MKAIVYYSYGSPDVIKLEEIPTPIPGDDEVLIKVHASSVNSPDWRSIRADPFFMRLADGLLRPKNNLLGLDLAGRVEAVGSNVEQFKPGDEVFGDAYECGFGAKRRQKNLANC
jgi:NADPH:quinone reductase-like Zn-dependent oxidoreductase